jgi:hypothetical protein
LPDVLEAGVAALSVATHLKILFFPIETVPSTPSMFFTMKDSVLVSVETPCKVGSVVKYWTK